MAQGQRPRELLLRLDELLAANPRAPSYNEDMNDAEFTAQQEQWHQWVSRASYLRARGTRQADLCSSLHNRLLLSLTQI